MEDYVFHKQTYRELSDAHGGGRRTIHQQLWQTTPQEKVHHPRPIHLVVDATYFGERKEGRSWCVLVARDPHQRENLVWQFAKTETTYEYALLREELEEQGYRILSVTGDGFAGIRGAFHHIPFQMCHVHMERLVIDGTTRHPQTEAGEVLLALVRTLPSTNSHAFTQRCKQFEERYTSFLNEKTVHPFTGEWSYTHEGVRSAWLSIKRLRPWLFTYEHDQETPKTTNSLEGHFRHLKKHLGVHAGLPRNHQQQVLHLILLASTTSPNKKTLEGLWNS